MHTRIVRAVLHALLSKDKDIRRGRLKSIKVGRAFECVGMDFKEMDASRAGDKYTFMIQDYLTK